jgi:hypothetical protein
MDTKKKLVALVFNRSDSSNQRSVCGDCKQAVTWEYGCNFKIKRSDFNIQSGQSEDEVSDEIEPILSQTFCRD